MKTLYDLLLEVIDLKQPHPKIDEFIKEYTAAIARIVSQEAADRFYLEFYNEQDENWCHFGWNHMCSTIDRNNPLMGMVYVKCFKWDRAYPHSKVCDKLNLVYLKEVNITDVTEIKKRIKL